MTEFHCLNCGSTDFDAFYLAEVKQRVAKLYKRGNDFDADYDEPAAIIEELPDTEYICRTCKTTAGEGTV